MPKFNYPVLPQDAIEMFRSPAGLRVLKSLGTDEASFGASCLRTGWTNKMHHKSRQEEDRELLEMLKEDPSLKQRLLQKVRKTA